nr:leucine-rich repeat domain-containing protein [uncultured Acetatifactor sp.]
MKRKKRITGVLIMVLTLIIMLLPVSEADAETSASDFKMEGSTLIKYRGTEKNVTIPNTVEVIGKSAFEENKNIELVVVPNSVKRIESYAFWGCDNLDTVVLGKGLSEVGDYSFTGCKGLVQMSVPSTVSSIGIEAFADCVNLKDITIPPETQYIHETSFEGCTKLIIHAETGSVAEQYAKDFYERQKEMPGYEETPDAQPSDPGQGTETPAPDVSTPAPGTEDPAPTQPPAQEEGNVLGSTHIVGNRAVLFMNNTIPTVYGNDKPQNSAAGFTESPPANTAWGDSIPKFRIVDGRIIADEAYYRCGDLGEISLPEGIEEVGQFSFARSSAVSVVLPEGVKEIGYGAFYHCDALEKVTLPDTVMCVEPRAFEHTLWVENFLKGSSADTAGHGAAEDDFLTEGGVLIAYRGNAAEVTVPADVRVIAAEVFKDHTEIESVSLPDSLRVVGEGAFEGCGNLAGLDLGNHVEEIKDRAFLGNVLGEVVLPASLKKIGLQAFGNAILTYGAKEVERTYESSATRLSNVEYRIFNRTDPQTPGVTVNGLEEAFGSGADLWEAASLEGADRNYTLTVNKAEDISAMEKAFQRAFSAGLPENISIYDLTMTDESGIPLSKLGSQALTVTLPVPENLKGQNLKLVTLDRNGQLEMLSVERVSINGVEAFQFRMNNVSMIGVCGVEDTDLR